ncbi:hypothetical protein R6Q57_015814 [Mikania cordata]
METLMASYGDTSSDSESDSRPAIVVIDNRSSPATALPPPPIDLLNSPKTLGTSGYWERNRGSRIQSFPHIKGNFALHVYIPVFIPSERKKELAPFLKKATSLVRGLHVVDIDVPLLMLLKDEEKLVQAALGREFHISLGRTVPIRVHQINRLRGHYASSETSVSETITKQIQAVNEVYQLHNLPKSYKDPRPHISIDWAVGDISQSLKRVVDGEMNIRINAGGLSTRGMFRCKFSNIVCKVGNKTYNICGSQEQ